MSEHYSKNTLNVTRWCNKCKRHTQFAVSDGRLGRCMEHEAKAKPAKVESKQADLFGSKSDDKEDGGDSAKDRVSLGEAP